ncbi:hypothetical protein, partial [Salmonella sp. s51228]|uniref:hypothetical protein n=1 Tax=Salmonella sp. s51228 TaxID=3159652 RepID=UPI0039814567
MEQQNKIVTVSFSDIKTKHDETLEQNIYLAQEMHEKETYGKREIQRLLDELRDLRTEMSVR